MEAPDEPKTVTVAGEDSLAERVAAAGARREARLGALAARRPRGVVHTPVEVARYLVREVDGVLRRELGLPGGVADPAVALIDPACGPGVFLAAAIERIERALPRFPGPARLLGVDLDPAAIEDARGVLGETCARRGWPLELRVANTLDDLDPFGGVTEVVVVVGNPPWAGRTANAATASALLLDDFRRDASGKRLRERKLGVLSDDYVRFWRWAAEIARRARLGAVVGLVTNSSFLDGPVHRGMRDALRRWFSGIRLVDLGGSSLVSRTGEADGNVFGVRPGAVATVLWRAGTDEADVSRTAEYRAVRGTVAEKLRVLSQGEAVDWSRLNCAAPEFLFRPAVRNARYAHWISLAELMPFHREGVQTNRDNVVVDRDREALIARLEAFARGEASVDLGAVLAVRRHYDPAVARRALRSAMDPGSPGTAGADADAWIQPIAYRPFDRRWACTVAPLCHRPRPELLRAVARSSAVLLCVRKDRGQRPFRHFGAVSEVPDSSWLSSRSSCRTRAFPSHRPDGAPNLDAACVGRWRERFGQDIGVDEVLRYVLAVLAAPSYAAEFADDLALDYPRIPSAPNAAMFGACVAAGAGVLHAFLEAPQGGRGGGRVDVGHRTVDDEALARAVREADRIVSELLRVL